MARKRNPVTPGEFEDPLNNYDPPMYQDELERLLCETEVKSMRITPVHCVSKEMTVSAVLDLMWAKETSCVVVTDEANKPLGVFSSKDVLYKIAGNDALYSQPIEAVMSPNPRTVYATDCPAKALNLMAIGGFRHIPVVDVDGKVVGMLAPRRTTEFLEAHMH